MEFVEKSSRDYVGYEYIERVIESSQVSLYLDSYECFGWQIDEKTSSIKEVGQSVLRLKRDRKILNKQELTRLHRNFESCMNQMKRLEQSKQSKATAISIIVGIVGTMFMACSVFAITATKPMIWFSILLAVPGFLGWISPLFLFRYLIKKSKRIITPMLEEKYEEIYEICKKGNRLLGNTE